MLEEPIFFVPQFQDRIWGGNRLASFNYQLPYEKTGECWAISAHSNGQSIVRDGAYQGSSLADLWENEAQLFGPQVQGEFPLLVKILDASDDLSVQVHPNDTQAQQLEDNEAFGKTECWYVLDAVEGAELILGHHASSPEEFMLMAEEQRWNELLDRISIKKGDFFYVPSGTIHAIGKGALILETQQSSDTTYRVYDFDRVDQTGKKRELHLEKAIKVTMFPHQSCVIPPKILIDQEAGKVRQLISSDLFNVYHCLNHQSLRHLKGAAYLLVSVVDGEGEIVVNDRNSYSVQKGDHFILPYGVQAWESRGEIELIWSHT
ncbi:type I phosphomannose isomerase catalytic subunit [Bacillus horti]|uniref:Mannose-6-phosphate isomerase n=2 Tax=Caldalkalibacillus horti TaxID=77523 RepID=A0ABT9VTM6_9BACI|nr:type I phosphomannose isomerase catalytic subunit [Bacillus horti]MDQ0164332.1 mannose-6-phosphate isomerase [Bacillus horti]